MEGQRHILRPRKPEPLWTIDQVALFLGISKATLYRWSANNVELTPVRVGNRLRYPAEKVQLYIDGRST